MILSSQSSHLVLVPDHLIQLQVWWSMGGWVWGVHKVFFSPPARWGSLDFNKGVPASLLLTPTLSYSLLLLSSPTSLPSRRRTLSQLRMQLGTPEPELYSASSGGSWARLDPNSISRDLGAAAGTFWPKLYIASSGGIWARGTHARENARKSAKQNAR